MNDLIIKKIEISNVMGENFNKIEYEVSIDGIKSSAAFLIKDSIFPLMYSTHNLSDFRYKKRIL